MHAIKKIKTSIISTVALLGLSVGSIVHANTNMSSSHTYADLLPSIIYANGKDSAAKEVTLSYEDIASYDDKDSNIRPYGSVERGDNSSHEGRILANYIYTLQKYGWITTKAKDSDWAIVRWGSELWSGFESTLVDFQLTSALFGASMYDIFYGLMKWFGEAISAIDVSGLLGVGELNDPENWINKFLNYIFTNLGINNELVTAVRYAFIATIVAFTIIKVMASLAGFRLNNAVKLLSQLAIRFFVIGFVIVTTQALEKGVKELTAFMTDDFNAVHEFDNKYVINTNDFAAYGQLDLTLMNNRSIQVLSNGVGDGRDAVAKNFEPTLENIQRLNQVISSRKRTYGSNAKDLTGAEYLNAIIANDQSNINDYVSTIKNIKHNSLYASDLPVSHIPVKGGNVITPGIFHQDPDVKNPFLKNGGGVIIPSRVYFLSANGDIDKNKDYKKIEEAYTAINGGKDGSKKLKELGAVTIHLNTSPSVVIPYSSKFNAYKMQRVRWKSLDTYIYGASASNSEASGDFNNFIDGKSSIQRHNPMSGSDKDFPKQGAGDDGEVTVLQQAMNSNSLAVAMHNRYGGITSTNGGTTLSTQSVAFILQSHLTPDAMMYQGYNVSVSKTDKGKASKANGATYATYAIPAYNKLDLMSRIAALNINWVLAGVCAFLGFFYLLKAPVLATVVKLMSNFFRALVTGNIIALAQYLSYFAAIQFAFGFAQIGVFLGSQLGQLITQKVPGLSAYMLGADTIPVKAINAVTGANLPTFGTIFVGLIMLWIMAWPVAEISMPYGGRRKSQKTGIIGVVIMLPFLLANAFDDYLDQFEYRLYGRSHRNSFLSKMGRNIKATDPLEPGKNLAKTVGQTALNAGAGFITGGVAGAGLAAAKTAMGGVINGVAGAAGGLSAEETSIDNYGDGSDRSGSLSGMIMGGVRDLRTGLQYGKDQQAMEDAYAADVLDGVAADEAVALEKMSAPHIGGDDLYDADLYAKDHYRSDLPLDSVEPTTLAGLEELENLKHLQKLQDLDEFGNIKVEADEIQDPNIEQLRDPVIEQPEDIEMIIPAVDDIAVDTTKLEGFDDFDVPLVPVETPNEISVEDPVLQGEIKDPVLQGEIKDPELKGEIKDPELKGEIKDPELKGEIKDPVLQGEIKDPELRGKVEIPEIKGEIKDPELKGVEAVKLDSDKVELEDTAVKLSSDTVDLNQSDVKVDGDKVKSANVQDVAIVKDLTHGNVDKTREVPVTSDKQNGKVEVPKLTELEKALAARGIKPEGGKEEQMDPDAIRKALQGKIAGLGQEMSEKKAHHEVGVPQAKALKQRIDNDRQYQDSLRKIKEFDLNAAMSKQKAGKLVQEMGGKVPKPGENKAFDAANAQYKKSVILSKAEQSRAKDRLETIKIEHAKATGINPQLLKQTIERPQSKQVGNIPTKETVIRTIKDKSTDMAIKGTGAVMKADKAVQQAVYAAPKAVDKTIERTKEIVHNTKETLKPSMDKFVVDVNAKGLTGTLTDNTKAMASKAATNVKETITKEREVLNNTKERVVEKTQQITNATKEITNNAKETIVDKTSEKVTQVVDAGKHVASMSRTDIANAISSSMANARNSAANVVRQAPAKAEKVVKQVANAAPSAIKTVDKAAGKALVKTVDTAKPVADISGKLIKAQSKIMGDVALKAMNNMAGLNSKNGFKNPFDPANNPYLKKDIHGNDIDRSTIQTGPQSGGRDSEEFAEMKALMREMVNQQQEANDIMADTLPNYPYENR